MIPCRLVYGASRYPLSSLFLIHRKRKRFLAFARNDDAGKKGFSLLPLEGGAPKGRRLDGDSGISETKPSPRGEGGERSEPDRVLAV